MKTFSSVSLKKTRTMVLFFVFVLAMFSWLTIVTHQAQALGILDVSLYAPSGEPLNAYNLIVDSNVTATSTEAPNVATVAVRYCNTGDMDLTNVWGYIGDFGTTTPGTYPAKVDGDFDSLPGTNPFSNGGTYSFSHIGSTSDASRFIGTIPAGECSVQYWHFTYPQCENDAGGVAESPPCNFSPAWGDSVKAEDDMSLNFDVWGTSDQGDHNETWTMWMRNEISAMANKIKPNPDGVWFNTDTSVVLPGETITTNGVLYEFGNINQGFDNSVDSDNDGIPDPAGQDGLPDYNAWAQPVGNPSYDPSCFQLISTETELTISRSGGLPPLIKTYTDQLYYTNLPSNNTGVRGEVRYTFLALDGACFSGLSPYQEVASGSDNEKFNGDFGTGIPPLQSTESQVGIDKSSSPSVIPTANPITTYTMPFWNNGDKDAGLYLNAGSLVNLPLLIQDTVPNGMQYACNSATSTTPDVDDGVTIYYSENGGDDWTTDETTITGCNDADPNNDPISTAGSFVIQWWLNGPLPANTNNADNFAQFQARVPGGYAGPSFVENCATAHFGPSGPAFDEACDIVLLEGTGSIGNFVWRDENWDGLQAGEALNGIDAVTVSLYWDKNNDDAFDEGDVLISTVDTDANGAYNFPTLPAGEYVVVVDVDDAPAGYRPTTPVTHAVTLAAAQDYDLADFGFGPILSLNKSLVSSNPAYEGAEVTYTIDLANNLPGNGQPPGLCTYDVWTGVATTEGTGNKAWTTPENAQGAPNNTFTSAEYGNTTENLYLRDFFTIDPSQTIEKVELIFYSKADGLSGRTLDIILDGTLLGTGNTYSDVSQLGIIETIDVTTSRPSWTFQDFVNGGSGTNPTVDFNSDGGGAADPAEQLHVDAVGFRITTQTICGVPGNTIDILPMTDTFDDTNFDFVSATPTQDSISSDTTPFPNTGVIDWDNIGPLYGGQTKQVIVTLKATQPVGDVLPGDQPLALNPSNCADSIGAQIAGGFPVNDVPQSCVPIDLRPGGSIGDFVWNDLSNPGIQDPGEPGIAGVTVNLIQGGSTIATTVTDANGLYLFEGLPDGTYSVQVDTTTLPNGGTGHTNTWDRDSGTNPPPNNDSGPIVLNNSDTDPNNNDIDDADFGYTIPTMIEGTIWHDWNENGAVMPDAGENWLEGVRVYINDGSCDMPPTGNANDDCAFGTTDANGYFMITEYTGGAALIGGTYEVVVYEPDTPVGYVAALEAASWTASFDTDGVENPAPPAGERVSVTVPTGGIGRADYSYYQTGSSTIGDTVYRDWDGDGSQEAGEEGIPNVTVYLYADTNDDGTPDLLVATTTTEDGSGSNPEGYYEFTNVPAGDYMVVVGNGVPTDHQQTQDPDENGTCVTCDGQSRVRNVDGTSDYLDEDFGYRPSGSGSIGDYVWQDTDGDGIQDDPTDEPPIQDITVTLYEDSNGNGIIDPEDAVIATTVTDADGNYLFQGLSTNDVDYIVQVDVGDADLPLGYTYPSTPPTVPVTLTSSETTYLDADFGFTGPARVGDYIWQDLNGDGEQDAWEVGINDVDVDLHTFTYTDTNNNGSWDWGEPTVLGPVVASTTTANAGAAGDGLYEFTNLPPGDYAVVVPATGNTGLGEPLEDTTNTGDPDAIACNVGCDNQTFFHLQPGQTDLSRDFGYQPTGLIGDYLWEDIDGDGVQDPGEPPLAGVTVNLSGSATDSVVTNAAGYYFFENVVAGTYNVTVDETSTPTGYSNALNSGSWNRTYDRDNGTTTPDGVVTTIVMDAAGFVTSINGDTNSVNGDPCGGGAGQVICNLEMDFGYRQATEISGTVFYDTVNDGTGYTPGTDIPYPNITVYLYDQNGDWYATTTTDGNGFYQFFVPDGGADPGTTYTVRYDATSTTLVGTTPTYEEDDKNCAVCNGETPAQVIDTTPVQNRDFGFQNTTGLDCGDLDESSDIQAAVFNTTLVREGACHSNTATTGVLMLGSILDLDTNGQPTATAIGDDNDGSDDEDGISGSGQNWVPGTIVDLYAEVNLGSSSAGYLVGWFDWDASGQFDNPNERIVYGLVTTSDTHTWSINLPADPDYVIGRDIFVRFRLYEASSGIPSTISPTGTVIGGEVEDYFWQFGPTAVSMQDFGATGNVAGPVGLVIVLSFILAAGSFIIIRRRKVME